MHTSNTTTEILHKKQNFSDNLKMLRILKWTHLIFLAIEEDWKLDQVKYQYMDSDWNPLYHSGSPDTMRFGPSVIKVNNYKWVITHITSSSWLNLTAVGRHGSARVSDSWR